MFAHPGAIQAHTEQHRSSGGSSLGTIELHSGVVNALTGAVERYTQKHYILSLEP